MSFGGDSRTIKKFAEITGQSQAASRRWLSRHRYDLEAALEDFYSRNPRPVKRGDEAKLNALFDQFAGEEEEDRDAMFGDSMASFFRSLDVDPEDYQSLAVAHRLACKGQGEITRAEFVEGLASAGVDSSDQIKTLFQGWVTELEDRRNFRAFYRWLFEYAKADPERRTVETEDALDLWSLVLHLHWSQDLAGKWCEFVEKEKPRAITKDVWYQVLEFAFTEHNFEEYDVDSSAWPGILDKFVEYLLKEEENGAAAEE